MATTETSICNSALTKIGAGRIISLDDTSERAKLLKEQYPLLRDALLYEHPWNFATARIEVAPLVAAPEYEFDFQYQLPSDCLRVYGTDMPKDWPWKVEGTKLLCNSSTLIIKYIKRVTDTSQFSSEFAEVLAWRIASEIAYSVTQSSSLRDSADAKYERALRQARSFDAQESNGDRVYADTWLNSRA